MLNFSVEAIGFKVRNNSTTTAFYPEQAVIQIPHLDLDAKNKKPSFRLSKMASDLLGIDLAAANQVVLFPTEDDGLSIINVTGLGIDSAKTYTVWQNGCFSSKPTLKKINTRFDFINTRDGEQVFALEAITDPNRPDLKAAKLVPLTETTEETIISDEVVEESVTPIETGEVAVEEVDTLSDVNETEEVEEASVVESEDIW